MSIDAYTFLIIAETFVLVASVVAGSLAAITAVLIVLIKILRRKLSHHKGSTNSHEMIPVTNIAYGVVRGHSAADKHEYEEISHLPRKQPNNGAKTPDSVYEIISKHLA